MTASPGLQPDPAHAPLASVDDERMPLPDSPAHRPRLAGPTSPAAPPPAGWPRARERRGRPARGGSVSVCVRNFRDESSVPVSPESAHEVRGSGSDAERWRASGRDTGGEMTSNTTLEQHLKSCTECGDGTRCVPRTPELLAEVPPEALLDGPPDDADLLLQRTLRHVRAGRRPPRADADPCPPRLRHQPACQNLRGSRVAPASCAAT
jgi:hypothetical protein